MIQVEEDKAVMFYHPIAESQFGPQVGFLYHVYTHGQV